MTTSPVNRGPEFRATFNVNASSVCTTTSLDRHCYVTGSSTVGLFTFSSIGAIPIGTIVEYNAATSAPTVVVNMFQPSRRMIGGGTVTAGSRLIPQAVTGYLVDIGASVASVPVIAIAITGATVSGQVFEGVPLFGFNPNSM